MFRAHPITHTRGQAAVETVAMPPVVLVRVVATGAQQPRGCQWLLENVLQVMCCVARCGGTCAPNLELYEVEAALPRLLAVCWGPGVGWGV